MKWNILLATLVTSVGLCTPSFGFELLDRMLGANGCGCDSKCCDGKDGSKASQKGCRHSLFGNRCGTCDGKGDNGKNGSCQKDNGKNGNGACQKSRGGLFGHCGCNGKGDNGKNGACQKSRGGLFGHRGCNGKGDNGKNGSCQKDGASHHGGCNGKGGTDCRRLIPRLFSCHCAGKGKGGCGHHGKGCDGNGKKGGAAQVPAPAGPSADPADDAMPPAPIVDPSAFVPSRHSIINASTVVR